MVKTRYLITSIIFFGLILIPINKTAGTVYGKMYHTDESELIKVPEGNGNPVLIDGIFSPGEWEDARKIDISQNVCLYLKKYNGHVFFGVKVTPYKTFVVDLFISPDSKSIHHLHTSAQISERLVSKDSGPWENPSFIWGYSVDWYANEIRWDAGKMQDLINKGKTKDEAQEISNFKYDGYEFQIKQSKFSSDKWLIRIEVPISPDFDKPIIFPTDTKMTSTKGWIRLELD